MQLTLHPHIDEIPAHEWDALLQYDQPFVRHAYLKALEDCRCVGADTGWQPAHAALRDADGRLVAAAPLYRKDHSYGEYVFDWAWADAFHRHGIDYYPKWVCAIPFTPVPGQRLLAQSEHARSVLLNALTQLCAQSGYSSLHVLLPQSVELDAAAGLPLLQRHGVQFHWENRGYRDFDDYLGVLSHDKRKKIKQERRKSAASGVSIRVLAGTQITASDWRHFYQCYAMTYALHRSTPYLNLQFFQALGSKMPESCVLIIASLDGRDVAASLLLRDARAIYGRYWGALEHIAFLHFELCYYMPIEYAISQGISRFEGGAQGEHKLARGLEAVRTYSMHCIANEAFREAIERFLMRETGGINDYMNELDQRSPIKRTSPSQAE